MAFTNKGIPPTSLNHVFLHFRTTNADWLPWVAPSLPFFPLSPPNSRPRKGKNKEFGAGWPRQKGLLQLQRPLRRCLCLSGTKSHAAHVDHRCSLPVASDEPTAGPPLAHFGTLVFPQFATAIVHQDRLVVIAATTTDIASAGLFSCDCVTLRS